MDARIKSGHDERVCADTSGMLLRPRHSHARVFEEHRPSEIRGRRECRAPDAHPQFSCERKHTRSSPQVRRTTPAFPARMVLTASFVLSPVIGLSCHRPRRDAKHHRQVDASVEASGPHDLAVHLTRVRLFAPEASTASPPNVRDDRETPLLIGHGMGSILPVIWEGDQLCLPAAD